ncbi:hypothetical protein TWF173_007649 [Orbilia oligospora]|uniref:Uncharacterized protein n=2 Tax=Orbilia oligospora TaxID=2813651 RepID=G1XA29_ARTOA|nr:hypothetical protein AOL_s00076g487 [Orbilia oligospora ATCC 24927]EGX50001.1 hypothetical protein AOL_s00076g487 [Orbilia oligospora ATCC 24927]KAF3276153.1 hypothetical protein TWF970_006438 [Orbilia oligospora]KAF3311977.1 hypothetical protein TWF173_007649 [Orbilia oligospora]
MVWNGDESIRPNNTALCTIDTCPVSDSVYGFAPKLAPNLVLLVLFSLSTIGFIFVGIWKKTWGFFIAMSLGGLLEVVGYIGRVGGSSDPFNGLGGQSFIIQICCLTVAPACYAAGIYLCLARIVIAFGEDISRIKPRWYTYIFVTCDLVSLITQSAGGAIASTSNDHAGSKLGGDITLGGLAFQVFTMTFFMVLCGEFALRCWNRRQMFDERQRGLRESKRFKYFLYAMGAATIFIYVRCVYRVAELAKGWDGPLMTTETYFIVLEGSMVILACLCLNIFHPGICFEASYASRSNGSKEDSVSMDELTS